MIKPLVGVADDGPGDASVVLPVRGSTRGLAVGCGINPRYGELDPYAMAGCVIDEAVRNCVAVGADPDADRASSTTSAGATPSGPRRSARWCGPPRPATTWPWPTARRSSRGKDSLNNEYTHEGQSLAHSADAPDQRDGPGPDVRPCVTMDLKEPGNVLLSSASTRHELGGSHWAEVSGPAAGRSRGSTSASARRLFRALHAAITRGPVRAATT